MDSTQSMNSPRDRAAGDSTAAVMWRLALPVTLLHAVLLRLGLGYSGAWQGFPAYDGWFIVAVSSGALFAVMTWLAKRIRPAAAGVRHKLDEIIDSLPDPTMVIDAEGRVLAWNREMELLTASRET